MSALASPESDTGYAHVAYHVQDGVAHVRLNRPDKLNVLGFGPDGSRAEILAALQRADADPSVGAILVSAEGREFCAGGDLTGAPPTDTPYDVAEMVAEIDRFHAGIRAVRKPVVAAVHGLCLGAGLGMLAQFDLVVAAEDARFGLVEGRIGHPGATELVPLIGPAWAKFLILTGELVGAPVAERIGLVLAVVAPDALSVRAGDLATRIAATPREAAILNKAAVNATADAMGRADGRAAGRTRDMVTVSNARYAEAPDGRRFADILATEGVTGLKAARDSQFTGSWLPTPANTKEDR